MALQDSGLALTKQAHDPRHSGPATARHPHPPGSGPSVELSLCLSVQLQVHLPVCLMRIPGVCWACAGVLRVQDFVSVCVGSPTYVSVCALIRTSVGMPLCCQGLGQGLGAAKAVPGVPFSAGQGRQKVAELALDSGSPCPWRRPQGGPPASALSDHQ